MADGQPHGGLLRMDWLVGQLTHGLPRRLSAPAVVTLTCVTGWCLKATLLEALASPWDPVQADRAVLGVEVTHRRPSPEQVRT